MTGVRIPAAAPGDFVISSGSKRSLDFSPLLRRTPANLHTFSGYDDEELDFSPQNGYEDEREEMEKGEQEEGKENAR